LAPVRNNSSFKLVQLRINIFQRPYSARHIWEDHKERLKENRLSKSGKLLYKKRKETVERSFADARTAWTSLL